MNTLSFPKLQRLSDYMFIDEDRMVCNHNLHGVVIGIDYHAGIRTDYVKAITADVCSVCGKIHKNTMNHKMIPINDESISYYNLDIDKNIKTITNPSNYLIEYTMNGDNEIVAIETACLFTDTVTRYTNTVEPNKSVVKHISRQREPLTHDTINNIIDLSRTGKSHVSHPTKDINGKRITATRYDLMYNGIKAVVIAKPLQCVNE